MSTDTVQPASEQDVPRQASSGETVLAKLSILSDPHYLPSVVDMVTDIAMVESLTKEDAKKLDALLLEVCRNTIRYGYGGDTSRQLTISLLRRDHSLVIYIDDAGIPFDYHQIADDQDSHFKKILEKGYADSVRFKNLGKEGNRVELVRELPSVHIDSDMNIDEHHANEAADEAHPDEQLELRMMTPDDAVALARAVFRCYGYSYASDFVYYPDQVRTRIQSGLMNSCAYFNTADEMVGHLALTRDHPEMIVAEAGQAVVDPRYRGHGLFKNMKLHLKDFAQENNIVGIFSEAVTVHPYSQKGNLALGAHEIGFLLGYSPGTVSFEGISEGQRPKRQSIALMYLPVIHGKTVAIYPPEEYREIVQKLVEINQLPRTVETGESVATDELPETGGIDLHVRTDHNQAFLIVNTIGKDTVQNIRRHLHELCLHRIDCIYVDLLLADRHTARIASELRNLGFFLGGVIPKLRGEDVLRMQYLNNVEIATDDISVASDFGKSLLETIVHDMKAVQA